MILTYQHVTCTSLVLKSVTVTAEFHSRHLQKSSFPSCITNSLLSDFRKFVLYDNTHNVLQVQVFHTTDHVLTKWPYISNYVCLTETEVWYASNWGLHNCAMHISPLKDVFMTSHLPLETAASCKKVCLSFTSLLLLYYHGKYFTVLEMHADSYFHIIREGIFSVSFVFVKDILVLPSLLLCPSWQTSAVN